MPSVSPTTRPPSNVNSVKTILTTDSDTLVDTVVAIDPDSTIPLAAADSVAAVHTSNITHIVDIDPILFISLIVVCLLLLLTCCIALHFAMKSKRNQRQRSRNRDRGRSETHSHQSRGELVYGHEIDEDDDDHKCAELSTSQIGRPTSPTIINIRAQPEGSSGGIGGVDRGSGGMDRGREQKMSFLSAQQQIPKGMTVITDFNSSEMYRDENGRNSQWSENVNGVNALNQISQWTTSEIFENPESDEEVETPQYPPSEEVETPQYPPMGNTTSPTGNTVKV